MYHAMRDILTNEIFRRVEPRGRTMGEYLREEFAMDFDIHIGVTKKDEQRLYDMRNVSMFKGIKDMSSPAPERYVSFSAGEFK